MTRRYALVEHVMVDRHAKKIEIIRAPDLLDRSLEELLATVQETETVDVGFLKTHERVTPNGIFDIGKELKVILHFTFADHGLSSPGQSESFFLHDVTLEGLEAKYDSWVEFLASGRSSPPFGLRSTIREICSFQGMCDEISLTIRVKP